jgi:hypothetical protein
MYTSKLLHILLLETTVDNPRMTDSSLFKKNQIYLVFSKNPVFFFFTYLLIFFLASFYYNTILSNQVFSKKFYSFLDFFYFSFFSAGFLFSTKSTYLVFYPQIYIPSPRSLFDGFFS